ncbi:MAG TPA: DUF4230 domain-containing protein [Saprospiraceae bacterium]|nr:DUF4230 domain-containing protein [Saprospiraceae bacterium]HQW54532.1 DUF4230 domain-containing protein [Saprospiraceae bacterium]
MRSTVKYLILFFGMILMVVLGYLISDWIHTRTEKRISSNSEIILEKVKKVAKVITIEGYFSEMYDYKDFYNFDWSIFRKKALIRVKARVSVGINLEKATFTADEKSKTLYIKNIPKPEILSIDHDIDYYDITEGTFNSFTPEDFNKINEDAKEHIRQTALKSDLFSQAGHQVEDVVNTFKVFAETAGWKVEVDTIPLIN